MSMRKKPLNPNDIIYKPVLYLKSNCKTITLAKWALECADRVLPYYGEDIDNTAPKEALEVMRNWLTGSATKSDARKAASEARKAAKKKKDDEISEAVAKCCYEAVSTILVKEHSIYASVYALFVIDLRDENVVTELNFQYAKLVQLNKEEKEAIEETE